VGTSAGSSANHTGLVTSINAQAGIDGTATLTVSANPLLAAPTVTKSFSPTTVSVDGLTQMTIAIWNPNASAITGAQVNDFYPAGMVNAGVNPVANTCNFASDIPTNGAWAKLANGTVPANGSCSVIVNVKGASP